MTMPETTQSDLVEQLEAWSDIDAEYGHHERSQALAQAAAEITRLRADSERLRTIENQIDGGRFNEWPTATFAGQLRMQSRDSLDPEYSQFMAATATHLGILSGQCDAQREIAERAKENAARLRAQCEAMAAAMEPFAKSGSIAGERNPYGDFYAYRPAAGDEYAIFGDHLREANRVFAAYRQETPHV
ncbi:hypothetical protein EDF56_101122 [Novosphingobium sp. PhB165]|uniref:hypothetical protein n=1 Tax=Novosphingobium sp. PhB165 TaxID=2485105 RepID=UPI0010508DF7|nr:hypothetical protein [Novosphingobium sp. PhB165]TCM21458.1 hypothetical protein EDF56_101122 [Novosphingobium sp. PhB165]